MTFDRRTFLHGAAATGLSIFPGGDMPLVAGGAVGGRLTIGMNLGRQDYWNTETALIDRMKSAAQPKRIDGADRAVPTGPEGWPVIATGDPGIVWLWPADLWARDYVVIWKGTCRSVEVARGRSVSRGSRSPLRVSLGPDEAAIASLRMRGIDPADPVRDISIVPVDLQTIWSQGALFDPAYVSILKGFSTIRAMKPMGVETSEIGDRRVRLTDANWGTAAPAAQGWPLEALIRLANDAGARPWICIPHRATEAVAREYFALAKALSHKEPVFELANEAWNAMYDVHRLYTSIAARDLRGDPGGAQRVYGRRVGALAIIAREYGFRMVAGTQTSTLRYAESVSAGIRDAGARDADISDWIITTYVDGGLNKPETGGPLAAANDIAGALDAIRADIPRQAALYRQHGDFARSHGWKLLGYEGANLHLLSKRFPEADQPAVQRFFAAVIRTDAVAGLVDAYLARFQEAGGYDCCGFALMGAPTVNGDFGYLSTLRDTAGTPTWRMLRGRMHLA